MKNPETQTPGREIPIDLLMNIFSRVPAKSIARFRCVSKFWESILCHHDFTELFLTMSPPLLFFTFEDDGKLFFFSSPYPQNLDENTSLVPTRYHVHHNNSPTEVTSPLCGFICHRDKGSLDTMVICNPVTGESVTLPKVELKSINTETRPYLGYDPIDKQLKVLCIKFDDTCDEHQVLTLGNGKHFWRTIQCKPHYPKSDGICIDGTLYYTAGFDWRISVSMIVCFDVRSEKFSFINIDECMLITASCTLINYKGKLGALQFSFLSPKCLEFWVLQDAEKHIWSKDIYTLPPFWNNIVKRTDLVIVGMTGGGEVVLAPYCLVETFYIYYFNLECKSLTRVQIHGLEMFKRLSMIEDSTQGRLFQVMSATEASKLPESNFSNKEKGTASYSVSVTPFRSRLYRTYENALFMASNFTDDSTSGTVDRFILLTDGIATNSSTSTKIFDWICLHYENVPRQSQGL